MEKQERKLMNEIMEENKLNEIKKRQESISYKPIYTNEQLKNIVKEMKKQNKKPEDYF